MQAQSGGGGIAPTNS